LLDLFLNYRSGSPHCEGRVPCFLSDGLVWSKDFALALKKKQNKTFIITHLKRNKKKRDSLAPTISQQTILWSRLFCGEGQAKQLHRGDLPRLNDPWWLTYPK
jgi:hypothetical protein